MGIKLAILTLFLLVSQFSMAQVPTTEITNAYVVSMTKAGIGEQTIILAIQRGPVKFDTAPQALIALKKDGVSDQVLNAILASVSSKAQASAEAQTADARAVFQKALDAFGPHEKVMAVHSVRWKGVASDRNQGSERSFERELIKIYPDKAYMKVKAATGQSQTQVVTPDFNYRITGTMTTAVPPADLDVLHDQFEFDTLQVAQHAEDYAISSLGEDQVGGVTVDKLRISKSGKSIIWEIDSQTGRLLSTRMTTASGAVSTEFSDWRLVDGVYLGFKRHVTQSQGSSDLTVAEYEINPSIDEKLFQRPIQAPSQGLTLKVLQAQSVPYTQESGGGVSTSCSIVGSANTSAYANTVGNSTYGNATTSSNQHMNCNSYDTTIRWPHVLNVMFAEASDGNSYMFACDRAWRWSKCVPLQTGQVFNARFTDKGLEIEAFSSKGKEENPTYHVLQSKSLR
jgi:hypothetical protein